MRKIVFVHLYNDRSGSPRVLSDVIRIAKKRGVSTELITSRNSYGFLNDVADKSINLFYRRSENRFVTLLFYIACQLHLFALCLRYRNDDVTFYVNTMMPVGAVLAGCFMKKGVLVHLHETSVRPLVLKKLLRGAINACAQTVVFVSQSLERAEGFTGPEEIVIPNAIDERECREEEGRGSVETFTVLMVCSLKKYKGVGEFLEIARRCEPFPYLRFRLVLNADDAEISRYFTAVSVPFNVTIIPRQVNRDSIYAESDLLLNLSRPDECVETFGLTILEAMCRGMPVIVPPVGGPSELVRDEKEGYLVSCYDQERIVELIIYLANEPNIYEQLSCNATLRASEFGSDTFEFNISDLLVRL